MANEKKVVDDELAKDSRFDRLPDEVVVSILDGLIWKDAAATSTLSRRFHHVWKSFLEGKKDLILKHNSYKGEGKGSYIEFMDFVNHILHKHKGSKVDSLQISFNHQDIWGVRNGFEIKLNDDFKNWVAFARAKCVQSLDIDLHTLWHWSVCEFPQFPTFEGFDKLTSLSLIGVRVNDADLEHGLRTHLVNLESLCLKHASSLERVVVASSQKLKKLVIECCYDIHSIDIVSAPNLECFMFSGIHVVIEHFNDMPKLSEVSLGKGALCQKILAELQKVEMLGKLKLHLSPICVDQNHVECMRYPPHFPLLRNLKELQLTFKTLEEFPLSFVNIVLAACPKLHKLKLENLCDLDDTDDENNWYEHETEDELGGASWQMHPCLKEVNISGWCESDVVQLVNHLRESAPNAVVLSFK